MNGVEKGQILSRMLVYTVYRSFKQNQDNILLNWFSFENQSRHIYSYHDILDVNKKGRAPVLHRKIW